MLRGFRLGLGFSILYFISLDECLPQSFISSLFNNSMGTTHKVSQQPLGMCKSSTLFLTFLYRPGPTALWFWERVEKINVDRSGKNIWNNWMNVIFFHLKNDKLLYYTIPNWSKTIIHKIPNIKPLNLTSFIVSYSSN